MIELPPCLMSPRELLRLQELAQDQIVLELGAWLGVGTIALAAHAAAVYSVDHHQGDAHTGPRATLGAYMANLEESGLRRKIVPIVAPFSMALPILRPKAFGLVVVDGAHDLRSVEHDVTWARRLVCKRGYIAVHDFNQHDVGIASTRHLGNPDDVVETLAVWIAP